MSVITTVKGEAPTFASHRRRLTTLRRIASDQVLRTSLFTVCCLLAVWWAVTELELISALFLPSPFDVVRKFWLVWNDGFVDATLLQHSIASSGRVLAALVAAVATGVPIGMAIALNPTARGIFGPIIEFYRPIPPLAYLPLVIIWCGIGELAKILVIYLGIFAPVVIATTSGVLAVKRDRVRAAQSLGASRLQVVTLVMLPSALPEILTGIRIGLGTGWATLVAAELVAATRGLGFMIQSAAQFLVTDIVVMGIFVIAAIAFAMELMLRFAQRLLVPWQGHE